MTPILSYEWVQAPSQPAHAEYAANATVVMLHGILGRRRNLVSFARLFVKKFPHLRVLLVDHRNHGESQGFDAPHTVLACANDLHGLLKTLDVQPIAVIGHSFGAGVALFFAQTAPTLRSLWLLDAVPGAGNAKVGRELEEVLSALSACSPTSSKTEFGQCLLSKQVPSGLIPWLSMNLWEDRGALAFRPNASLAGEMLSDFRKTYRAQAFTNLGPHLRVFLVKAEKNEAWGGASQEIDELVRQRNLKDFVLAKAGHFVHIDNPAGLIEMMEGDFA